MRATPEACKLEVGLLRGLQKCVRYEITIKELITKKKNRGQERSRGDNSIPF